MVSVPPVTPTIVPMLAQALESAAAQLTANKGAQLVTVVATLLQASPGVQNTETSLQLVGVVVQPPQNAPQNTVALQTARGTVMVQIPPEEMINLPLPDNTPVRVLVTPPQLPPSLPTQGGSVAQPPMPVVALQMQDTVIKAAKTPTKHAAPAATGAPSAPSAPSASPVLTGTMPSRTNNLWNLTQNASTPMPTKPELAAGQNVRVTFLPIPSGNQSKGQMVTRTAQPEAAPPSVLATVVKTAASTNEAMHAPLGQIAVKATVQSQLPDGTMTAIITGQDKTVAGHAPLANLVGQRVHIAAVPSTPLLPGSEIQLDIPETIAAPPALPKLVQTGDGLLANLADALTATSTAPDKISAGALVLLNLLDKGHAKHGASNPQDTDEELDAAIPNGERARSVLNRMLGETLARLTGADDAPAPVPMTHGWRSTQLPTPHGEGVMAAWMHLHIPDDPNTGRESAGQKAQAGKVDRFVFDVSLTRMGQMQIDGMVREKSVAVVLRSEQSLSPSMQSSIQDRFISALGAGGYDGHLRFQVADLAAPDWAPWHQVKRGG